MTIQKMRLLKAALAVLVVVLMVGGFLEYTNAAYLPDVSAPMTWGPTPTNTPTPLPTATPLPTNTPRPCGTGTPTPHPTYSGTLPPVGTAESRVAHCVDDAHEVLGDATGLSSDSDYVRTGELSQGAQFMGGFLFRDVRVPQGAQIVSATLRLIYWYQSGAPMTLEVIGELSPQAIDFSAANPGPHERPRTAARAQWTINDTGNVIAESPNLAGVVQEIVGQTGWRPGNDLALLIKPGTERGKFADWQAFDFSAANAAQLVVSYRVADETPTPLPTDTLTPTATSSITPTATATESPTNTPTVTASPTATPTDTSTLMPSPTSTLTPTATPTGTSQRGFRRYLPLMLQE